MAHDLHRVAGRGLSRVVGGDDVNFQRLAAGLTSQRGGYFVHFL
jgi:hypothetical protein